MLLASARIVTSRYSLHLRETGDSSCPLSLLYHMRVACISFGLDLERPLDGAMIDFRRSLASVVRQ
jgi:hypothetical protein